MNYVYQYKDHLGNVRLSYTDNNNDGVITPNTEIIEESNYYPFGLKHKGYNDVVQPHGNSAAQKFGYVGKELNEELGLEWHDFGARNYDAALGRWMNLDPLAEQMRRHSPYNYAFDNPVYFIDPDGMAPIGTPPGGGVQMSGIGYMFSRFKRAVNNYKNGDTALVAVAKAFRDDPIVENVADEFPGAGEALDISKGNYVSAAIGLIPGGKKVKKIIEGGKDLIKGTKKTSKAARKEVMRKEGIPTSQQPKSQSINDSGREYTYEVPKSNTVKSGGSTMETKSVQQQTKDRSHKEQPHWEAGKVKVDPSTGDVRMNKYNRPKLSNDKSKVDYDE